MSNRSLIQNQIQTGFVKTDGVNSLPYIQGGGAGSPHPTLYWRQNHQWAIRDGNWKLIKPKGQDEVELYDLSTDKEEQHNLAINNQDRVNTMKNKHDLWASEMMQPQWGWQKGIDGNYKKE